MKRLVVIGLILVAAFSADAQVFFRNDFLITHRQHRKVENLGLRFITINVTNHPNWNQLINGRGGGTMVIDVRALREPSRRYSYSEIAEKVYVPATITEPRVVTVPQFLLQPPPVQRRLFFPLKRVYLTGI